MKKILISLFGILLFFSCTEFKENSVSVETGSVSLVCETGTKTSISGYQLNFEKGDQMGLYVKNINTIRLTNAKTLLPNCFDGHFYKVGTEADKATYVAVYPFSGYDTAIPLNLSLASVQNGPFDANANYMYSQKMEAKYDEEDMPKDLHPVMNQMMGLIRVTIFNEDSELEDEQISEVYLSSSTDIAGSFSFDPFDDSPQPIFDSGGEKKVRCLLPSPVALGNGMLHVFYLFVRPTEITEPKLGVVTTNYKFTRSISHSFPAPAGDLTYFPDLNLSSFDKKYDGKKVLACWGDSYTSYGGPYSKHLQNLLGNKWEVFNGGDPGDVSICIAARQGGVGMITGQSVTIPAGEKSVVMDGIYTTKSTSMEDGNVKLTHVKGISPCRIMLDENNYIEGSFTYSSGTTTFTMTTAATSDIVIPTNSTIIVQSAIYFHYPALTVIYMGQNGGYSSLEKLYRQHRAMIDFTKKTETSPENYIVLGFHNHSTLSKFAYGPVNDKWWLRNNSYWESFNGPHYFGIGGSPDEPGNPNELTEEEKEILRHDPTRQTHSRFIDLYHEILDRPAYWLYYTGASPTEGYISPEDQANMDLGRWPLSFYYNPTTFDIHPSDKAAKAMAKLIYDKMEELGYLDE